MRCCRLNIRLLAYLLSLTALLAVAVLRTAFVTATLAALTVALLATAVLLRTAFVAATLTIFVTPLLSVVVIALILLLILLHIPLRYEDETLAEAVLNGAHLKGGAAD